MISWSMLTLTSKIYSIFPQTGNIGPWIFLSSNIYLQFQQLFSNKPIEFYL